MVLWTQRRINLSIIEYDFYLLNINNKEMKIISPSALCTLVVCYFHAGVEVEFWLFKKVVKAPAEEQLIVVYLAKGKKSSHFEGRWFDNFFEKQKFKHNSSMEITYNYRRAGLDYLTYLLIIQTNMII